MKNFIPLEDRRFCGVPIEDEHLMEWDDLIQDHPIRYNDKNPDIQAVATSFMVKYDGRKPKPSCLAPYTDYSYAEAGAIAADPTSPWHQATPNDL